MALHVTRAQAERLARNVDQEPLPPKPARQKRITLDERLCRAGWMPRCRVLDGVETHDYWQASGSGESAGVADSYAAARRLALGRLPPV